MTHHRDDRDLWNDRYGSGEYPPRERPARLLSDAVDWLPAGRALDVATGVGRNALCLADQGYEVDAVDVSEEGLAIARRRANDRGLEVNWIQADLETYALPTGTYSVVCVIGYHDLNLIGDLKDALAPGGVLLYEHHLGPAAIADRGPSSDRFRFRSNELLRACLDLTVLEYRERSRTTESERGDVEIDPIVSLIARNGLDGEPWYPPERA